MGISRRLRIRRILLMGFLRLIRWPNLLFIILTQYFVRIFLVGPRDAWVSHFMDVRFLMLTLSTVLVAAAGYIINDYYDIKIDTINKPKRVVVGRILRRRWAMISHLLLNVTGILLAFMVDWKVGLVTFVSGFLLWLYSNQLKRQPFTGNFTIALLTAASLLVVWIYQPRNEFLVYTFAAFAFFISLIREIIKDMEDVRGDATFGCQTLPIIWGIRRTKILLYILIFCFLLVLFSLSAYLQNVVVMYFCFFILVPVGWLTYKLFWADTKREFSYLSKFCKLIMLSGILSMALV
ncbi:geranylgeranylglycerol-phosphate geranylgeranyltransferase [Rhodocytophaga aerolata]|uniref:Geranylgeranylglycerol-phosphate geranylgeranyltransferase n=1 Tax=Rhodocytophaga aerolata TaxID=455078 RepID=A0ABT8RB61_9BACT|nr:geranylgeranylglycerol-phosphate geranylgeranyltransferase [Rhodocytophaga aerolata]MDO1448539.1 geranylgeranylglycerol-phosphate geranylgeranyltransferase [Rhodocytophaga aerolata]